MSTEKRKKYNKILHGVGDMSLPDTLFRFPDKKGKLYLVQKHQN
jgi:hypothetical protein